MRFWITKNSELPIREQLVRQVVLGILSEDLPAGHKLPSVRALARRHQIHSNTVSAAYHDLLEQGWLELRRGSGLYVRAPDSANDLKGGLDRMVAMLLQSARSQGYEPEEVLRRIEHLVRPRAYERVVIAEPDRAMGEILEAEISEHVGVRVEVLDPAELAGMASSAGTFVVALPTRAEKLRRRLPDGAHCIPLLLRSVRVALEGEVKPGPHVVVSIVSRSVEIRQAARAMLIAVGLDPGALHEIDADESGWLDRIGRGAFVVTDVVVARELPAGCMAKVFRVIADSSIDELRQLCGGVDCDARGK
jgi:DNA-binding transcriptional regulator YhcF (GntR family)